MHTTHARTTDAEKEFMDQYILKNFFQFCVQKINQLVESLSFFPRISLRFSFYISFIVKPKPVFDYHIENENSVCVYI